MKKISPLTRLLSLLMMASLAIAGCKKETSQSLSPAEEEQVANLSSESETQQEVVFNDIFDNVIGVNTDVGIGGTGVFGRMASPSPARDAREMGVDTLPPCLTITVTPLNPPDAFPVRIVMDFGSGCFSNGHLRSGKIITVYDGRLVNPGKSATTTFDGFKIDSLSIQGTHKITNTGTLSQRQFTVDITDARLTHPNGNYSLWSSHRVITQVEGGLTLYPQDDVFTIQGYGHGRVQHNNLLFAWQSEIIEALRKRFSCHWISRGIIRVRRETLPTSSPWVATLNYGDGTCDYLATLTLNGTTHQILLPH